MLAVGLGVIAIIVLGALLRSAIAIGAAIALTSYVALPGFVDVLTWVAAGGYVLVQGIGAFVALAAIANAGSAARRLR